MTSRDDSVDLVLGVETAGLKVFDEPPQDRQPFLALDRDRDQTAGHVDEVLEYVLVVAWYQRNVLVRSSQPEDTRFSRRSTRRAKIASNTMSSTVIAASTPSMIWPRRASLSRPRGVPNERSPLNGYSVSRPLLRWASLDLM